MSKRSVFISSLTILIVNAVFFFYPELLNLPYIDRSDAFNSTRTQDSLLATWLTISTSKMKFFDCYF